METIGTNDPVKSSSQSVGIDWPVLTYWVTYLSIVFGILLRSNFGSVLKPVP